MKNFAKILSAFIFLVPAISGSGQTASDFTGLWQRGTASGAQRQLDVTQNRETLLVKTIVINSQGTQRLEVKYEIGGPEVTYTGLDGDEFRESVRWDGSALVFDTIEHERGKEIDEKTVWTLSDDHKTLRMDRQATESGKTTDSSASYARQAQNTAPPQHPE